MYLQEWKNRLTTIFDEEPLQFVSLEQYDLKKGLILKEDSAALKATAKDVGLSIGQNLGRAFPAGSMLRSQNKVVNGK